VVLIWVSFSHIWSFIILVSKEIVNDIHWICSSCLPTTSTVDVLTWIAVATILIKIIPWHLCITRSTTFRIFLYVMSIFKFFNELISWIVSIVATATTLSLNNTWTAHQNDRNKFVRNVGLVVGLKCLIDYFKGFSASVITHRYWSFLRNEIFFFIRVVFLRGFKHKRRFSVRNFM